MPPAARCLRVALVSVFVFLPVLPSFAADVLHHDLEVRIEPSDHRIDVTDRIRLPGALAADDDGALRFVLHADLELLTPVAGYELELLEGTPDARRYGINEEDPEGMWPQRMAVTFDAVDDDLIPVLESAANFLENLS